MSVSYNYTASTYHSSFTGPLDALCVAISAEATIGSGFEIASYDASTDTVTVSFASALDGPGQTALDDIFDAWELEDTKQGLFVAIDAKVRSKIADEDHFEWPASSGNYHSLSANAQLKWLGMYNTRTSLTYPFKVRTRNDKTQVSLADATAVANAYAAATAELLTLLTAAEDVKNNVEAAATVAAANAAAAAYLA